MAACCHAREYSSLFGGGEAALRAWLFRHFGLRGSAAVAADFAAAAGGPQARVLEVGGGLGELHVTLLESGHAAAATNVELSTAWEDRARHLLAQRDQADRVDRRLGDIVDADDLPTADVVVAHRVLCCYPDWRRMVDALATHARRRVVITLPVDRRRMRAVIGLGNWWLGWRGLDFRAFVHPTDRVLARFAKRGMAVAADHVGWAWRTIALAPTRDRTAGTTPSLHEGAPA